MTRSKGILALAVTAVLAMGCVTSGKYDDLDAAYKQSQDELFAAKAQVQGLEGDLISAGGTLSEQERALAELREREAQKAARIAEFQELTNKFKAMVDAGKLRVSVVNGRMVVQMQTDVLFDSGSAKLSEEGRAAVEEVSGLLASLSERRYQIEGHTDNVPIKTTVFPSNWELAAGRAITVVEVMTNQGMTPQRVSAVSYGDTTPIAANDSEEGRALNRRIEIVLVPDLSQLPGFAELQEISEGSPADSTN